MSLQSSYTLINQSEDGVQDNGRNQKLSERGRRPHLLRTAFVVCFILSILLNAQILLKPAFREFWHGKAPSLTETPYARLKRDQAIKWVRYSPFNSDNRTEEDEAWSKTPGFHVQSGIVALADPYVEEMGLPTAQRWPWDDSKGIYFVEGLHALHCVVSKKYLRKAVYEISDSRSLSMTIRHLKHCLDGLRQFVMCHADDTPRYTGRLHDQAREDEPAGGIGQPRMCRDWSRLIEWTTANSACYEWVPGDQVNFTEADRYKSCPDGRVYWM